MAASIAWGCGGKGYFAGLEPFGSRYAKGTCSLHCCHRQVFHADNRIHPQQRKFSIGAAAEEGPQYRFVVANLIGRTASKNRSIGNGRSLQVRLCLAALAAVKTADGR